MVNNSKKNLMPRMKNSDKKNSNSPTSSTTSLRDKLSKVLVAMLSVSTIALMSVPLLSRNLVNVSLNAIVKVE